ncbi:MAG: hypothetical protein DMG12_24295 [Acidobacteria bacterium]|nr:MAG: hypothetical protein DMG12_24295 [Acidobacteriota bacterium]
MTAKTSGTGLAVHVPKSRFGSGRVRRCVGDFDPEWASAAPGGMEAAWKISVEMIWAGWIGARCRI